MSAAYGTLTGPPQTNLSAESAAPPAPAPRRFLVATLVMLCLGAGLLSSTSPEAFGLQTTGHYGYSEYSGQPAASPPPPPVKATFKVNDAVTFKAWDNLNNAELNKAVQDHGSRYGTIMAIRHVPFADPNVNFRKGWKYDRDTCPPEGCSNKCGWSDAQKKAAQEKVDKGQEKYARYFKADFHFKDAHGNSHTTGGGDRRVLRAGGGSIKWVVAGTPNNCNAACAAVGAKCDVTGFSKTQTESGMAAMAAAAGSKCTSHGGGNYGGAWDGPWVRGGTCWRNTGLTTNCGVSAAAGYNRLCPCAAAMPAWQGMKLDYSKRTWDEGASNRICEDGSADAEFHRDCHGPMCKGRKQRGTPKCARGTDCKDCGYCTRTHPEYYVKFGVKAGVPQGDAPKIVALWLSGGQLRRANNVKRGTISIAGTQMAVTMLPRDPKDVGVADPTTQTITPDLFVGGQTGGQLPPQGKAELKILSGDTTGWVQLQKIYTGNAYRVSGAKFSRNFFKPGIGKGTSRYRGDDAQCNVECQTWAATLGVLTQAADAFTWQGMMKIGQRMLNCEGQYGFEELFPGCFEDIPGEEQERLRSHDTSGLKDTHNVPMCLMGRKPWANYPALKPLVTLETCSTTCECPTCKNSEFIHNLYTSRPKTYRSKGILLPMPHVTWESFACNACSGTCGFLKEEAKQLKITPGTRCGDGGCKGRAVQGTVDIAVQCGSLGKEKGLWAYWHTNPTGHACHTQKWNWGPYVNRKGFREIRLSPDKRREASKSLGSTGECLTANGPIKNGAQVDVKPCTYTTSDTMSDFTIGENKFQKWNRRGENIILEQRGPGGMEMCLNLNYNKRSAGAVINVEQCLHLSSQQFENNDV